MVLQTAAHTAGAVEGAVAARLDAVALWALQGPGPLDVRPGVVYAPGNPMQVLGTSATSPWAVTVGTGHVVAKKSGISNGVYYSCNDALTTVNLAVPPVSNSRIDTIYAMQQDLLAVVDADGATAAVISAVQGTGGNGGLGATPTAPPVPVGAVALYSVQIASTATTGTSGAGVTITRLFGWTVPRGVPIPVFSAAERDLITLREDLRVYRLDLHLIEVYNGTAWIGAPTAYTPVLTSATLATGGNTATGRYIQVGKQVTVWFNIAMQALSATVGSFEITLPVPPAINTSTSGAARYFDSSTGFAMVGCAVSVNGFGRIALQHTVTFAGTLVNTGYPYPWAWATGDFIDGFLTYEAA
jgi:hypothetical protein